MLPNQSPTWIVSLFHPCHKKLSNWSLIITKTFFLLGKYQWKWIVLSTSAGNLLHSLLWIKEPKCDNNLMQIWDHFSHWQHNKTVNNFLPNYLNRIASTFFSLHPEIWKTANFASPLNMLNMLCGTVSELTPRINVYIRTVLMVFYIGLFDFYSMKLYT